MAAPSLNGDNWAPGIDRPLAGPGAPFAALYCGFTFASLMTFAHFAVSSA